MVRIVVIASGLGLCLLLTRPAAAESIDLRADPTIGLKRPVASPQPQNRSERAREPRVSPSDRVEEPSEGYYIDMERRYLHIQ